MTRDRMRSGFFLMMATLVLSAGCAGTPEDSATADAAASGGTTAAPMSAEMHADVQKAAAIANATAAAPTKGDSILTANQLTADQLEEVMYRIAADSAASAEYRRLTSGN